MNLTEKNNQLRDILNESIFYKQQTWNKKNNGEWDKLWTAIDNIEDTQLAIGEFSNTSSGKLPVYGVLQALVVQQDAVKRLEQAIEIESWSFTEYPELLEIRNIRNETIGHPVATGDNKKNSSYEEGSITYTSIYRTDKLSSLEYAIWSKDGFKKKEVDINNIIKIQENLFIKEIDKIIVKIKKDEDDHAVIFKDDTLAKLLSPSGYFIQKLWPFERTREYSKTCLESLVDLYERFKQKIKERYKIENFDDAISIPGLIVEIQKIDKLLPRIERMVLMDDSVDRLDLEVYVDSLDSSFITLNKMAKEIDKKFKS